MILSQTQRKMIELAAMERNLIEFTQNSKKTQHHLVYLFSRVKSAKL